MFRTHRSIRSQIRSQGARLAAAAGLALVGASSAGAQWGNTRYPGNNTQLAFAWEGTVDRETEIVVGRSGVSVRGVTSNESRGRVTSRGTLPRGTGTLYVQRVDGRGSIDVVRQPSSNGNGDGVIRIRDPQGGADRYAIRVYWQPSGNVASDRRDRDGSWGRDGDWDRDRRNDRGDRAADRADRRADQFERQAEKFERKAEQARRKAERRDDRDDRRDRRGW